MEKPFEEFGSLIFGEHEMQERLPYPIYLSWKKTVENEETLDRPTADAIAHAMKRWALEKGATHYTHWFQPMTGSTAEKHDSFIDPGANGEPMTRFSGKSLIKGEPDASSFPSGGLRATFEARGYTYWDVTSPVFIKNGVLCIPTVFVSYNGESLDTKDPLLKSIRAISDAATKTVNLLGEKDVKYCTPVVGLEQEYFLIDKKDFDARLDLKLTGRTLFGASAPKGQELEDHYFAVIPERVREFMSDVNEELWRLGIYAKTEHNEVAPGQFELAVVYNNVNIAVDQNQLIMDTLKRNADKHDLACLLHEKPFDGINGSGKHDNYSIVTSNGQNLFSPGDKPAENIRFLVFMCAFLKAADTYPELLRYSASSGANDHRLGADEAPPAIISIYLGSYIEDILFSIYKEESAKQHLPLLFNDEETVKWIEWWAEGVKEGYFQIAPTTGDYNSSDLNNGAIASYIGSCAGLPFLDLSNIGGEVGVVRMPYIDENHRQTTVSNRSIIGFKKSETEDAAVAKFAEYFITRDGEWAEELSAYSPYFTIQESDAYKASVAENIALKAVGEQINDSVTIPAVTGSVTIRDELKKVMTGAADPNFDAKAALENAVKVGEAAMNE